MADNEIKTTAPVYDWDALLPSTDAPAHVVGPGTKVDVLKEIPAGIRQRVEDCLVAGILAKVEWITAGKVVANYRPAWKLQRVADEAQGKAFIKMLTRYAKYRPEHWEGRDTRTPSGQITVRTGAPLLVTKDVATGATLIEPYWAVRYNAKPLEVKTDTARVPGSAK